jgi:hypothetical protein
MSPQLFLPSPLSFSNYYSPPLQQCRHSPAALLALDAVENTSAQKTRAAHLRYQVVVCVCVFVVMGVVCDHREGSSFLQLSNSLLQISFLSFFPSSPPPLPPPPPFMPRNAAGKWSLQESLPPPLFFSLYSLSCSPVVTQAGCAFCFLFFCFFFLALAYTTVGRTPSLSSSLISDGDCCGARRSVRQSAR